MLRERRRSRRTRIGALALGSALLGLVTACTSGESPSVDPTPTPSSTSAAASPSASDAPVTLRFAVYGGGEQVAAYRRLASAFERRQPNVTVRVETAANAATSWQEVERQLDAGRAPDVFLADSDLLPQLVAGKRVQPVDELLEQRDVEFGDTYERLGLEAFAADSALQCMPNDVSPYVVFYNRRLLDLSVTVPPGEPLPTPEVNGWSWRQFALSAQAASRDGVQGVYLPPELTTLAPLLRSAGADIVDDVQTPTTLTLADGGSRATLEAILQVARDPRVNPTPEQLLSQDAVTRFEKGRLAMMIGTRAMVPQLRRAGDLRFDAYPLPSFGRFQTIADVSGYCIPRGTQHVAEAADFLAFASSNRGARITARSGGVVPANLIALRSPAFAQPGQFPVHVNVFTTVIRRAETMPNPPAWPAVVARTQPLLGRLFYDTVLDLDTQLPEIDKVSATALAEPTATPTPTQTTSPSG